MRKIINDCFTEKDGKTYDIVRIFGAFSLIILNLLATIHLFRNNHDFNFLEIASGMSLMLGTISAGVVYKYSKE